MATSVGMASDNVAELRRRLEDVFLIFFFATHVPVTILFDAQCVLPNAWYPKALLDAFSWYVETFQDPLLGDPPTWFRTLVWSEVFFQLPFFILATHACIFGKDYIRLPCLAYSGHVVTTMLPILVTLYVDTKITHAHGQRLFLVALYLPYLFVPLWLGCRVLWRREEDFFRKKRKTK